jgi:phage terminase large subunit-like protein
MAEKRKWPIGSSTPKRESLETLLRLKQSMGSENFAAQFQQDRNRAGLIIQRHWIQRYDETASLPNFTSKVISLDTANKCGELNDFSVHTVWGVFDGRYFCSRCSGKGSTTRI